MEGAITSVNQACEKMQKLAMAPIKQAKETASDEQKKALETLEQATDWQTLKPWVKQHAPNANAQVVSALKSHKVDDGLDFAVACQALAGAYTGNDVGPDQNALHDAQLAKEAAEKTAALHQGALSASVETLVVQTRQPIVQFHNMISTIKDKLPDEQRIPTASYEDGIVEESKADGEACPLSSRHLMNSVQTDDQSKK